MSDIFWLWKICSLPFSYTRTNAIVPHESGKRTPWSNKKLEIAAQGVAQCKVSATRVVADAALRRIG